MEFTLTKSVTPLEIQQDIVGTIDCFKNDTYTVSRTHKALKCNPITKSIIHLVISRNDNQPIHSWPDFQTIKNVLVGPEHTGIEVFPPESQLTDAANCYHIWVIPNDEFRLPFTLHQHRVVVPK